MGKPDLGRLIAQTMAPPAEGRTIEVITGEILDAKRAGGEAILTIGRCLIEAKDMSPSRWMAISCGRSTGMTTSGSPVPTIRSGSAPERCTRHSLMPGCVGSDPEASGTKTVRPSYPRGRKRKSRRWVRREQKSKPATWSEQAPGYELRPGASPAGGHPCRA